MRRTLPLVLILAAALAALWWLMSGESSMAPESLASVTETVPPASRPMSAASRAELVPATSPRAVERKQPSDALEVITLDAEDGAPVDPCEFKVGLAFGASGGFTSDRVPKVIARPGPGIAWIAPVSAMRSLLIITPRDGAHARCICELDVRGIGAQSEIVRVSRAHARALRVLGRGGLGVAKARFELSVATAANVPAMFRAIDPDKWVGGHFPRVRMQLDATGADGEARLVAAPGVRYELELSASDHAPAIVQDVYVTNTLAPLVVTLESGATIFGKVAPEEAVARMWRSDAELAKGGVHRPAIWLHSLSRTPSAAQGAFTAQIPLQQDGSFRREGIPPGSWKVHMYWYDATTPHNEMLGEVKDLQLGERREVEFRLDHVLQHELVVTVLLDDQPFAKKQVKLTGTSKHATGEPRACASVMATTDDQGRVTAMVEPGVWHAQLPLRKDLFEQLKYLPSADSVEVRAGARTVAILHARRTKVVITLRDASGQIVAGEHLGWSHSRYGLSTSVTTDARGVAELDYLPVGTLTIVSNPEMGHAAGVPRQPTRRQSSLGTIEIAGDRAEVTAELKLPAAK